MASLEDLKNKIQNQIVKQKANNSSIKIQAKLVKKYQRARNSEYKQVMEGREDLSHVYERIYQTYEVIEAEKRKGFSMPDFKDRPELAGKALGAAEAIIEKGSNIVGQHKLQGFFNYAYELFRISGSLQLQSVQKLLKKIIKEEKVHGDLLVKYRESLLELDVSLARLIDKKISDARNKEFNDAFLAQYNQYRTTSIFNFTVDAKKIIKLVPGGVTSIKNNPQWAGHLTGMIIGVLKNGLHQEYDMTQIIKQAWSIIKQHNLLANTHPVLKKSILKVIKSGLVDVNELSKIREDLKVLHQDIEPILDAAIKTRFEMQLTKSRKEAESEYRDPQKIISAIESFKQLYLKQSPYLRSQNWNRTNTQLLGTFEVLAERSSELMDAKVSSENEKDRRIIATATAYILLSIVSEEFNSSVKTTVKNLLSLVKQTHLAEKLIDEFELEK